MSAFATLGDTLKNHPNFKQFLLDSAGTSDIELTRESRPSEHREQVIDEMVADMVKSTVDETGV